MPCVEAKELELLGGDLGDTYFVPFLGFGTTDSLDHAVAVWVLEVTKVGPCGHGLLVIQYASSCLIASKDSHEPGDEPRPLVEGRRARWRAFSVSFGFGRAVMVTVVCLDWWYRWQPCWYIGRSFVLGVFSSGHFGPGDECAGSVRSGSVRV